MSESRSGAASDSSYGVSAFSVQSESRFQMKPELEEQCTDLTECIASSFNPIRVPKSRNNWTDAPPKSASQSVATQTSSPKEETEEALDVGTTGRLNGATDKEKPSGACGVGDASRGLNQATQAESEGAPGGTPDSRTNSGAIITSGDQVPSRVESQEPSSSSNHEKDGHVDVELEGPCSLRVKIKCDRKDSKELGKYVVDRMAKCAEEQAGVQKKDTSTQSFGQYDIPTLPLNERNNSKVTSFYKN